jgi:hypothetical protein
LWKFLPANQGGELGGSTLRGGSLSSCEAAVDEAFRGEQQTELVASIEGRQLVPKRSTNLKTR